VSQLPTHGKCGIETPPSMFTLFNKLNNILSHPEDIVLELCTFELEGGKRNMKYSKFH
jgi:hypothetical protein